MSHPVDLLHRADPARPLVTFYDDATAERVELSGKTLGNWVAKTANLLVDGLGAEPGTRVALALPAHWQKVVWLFACWSAELLALPGAGTGAIVAADPENVAGAAAPEVVGLSLHALGAPLAECPPSVTDYAVEVRAYGDRFDAAPDPSAPAVEYDGAVRTGAELVADAEAAALPPGSRVLTTVSFDAYPDLLAGLLAPLAAGGSVVLCRNTSELDEMALDRRMSLEHATALVR